MARRTVARLQTPERKKPSEKEEDPTTTPLSYVFEGVAYETYQEMVNAKRKRNQQVLEESGLLSAAAALSEKKSGVAVTRQKGLKKRKASAAIVLPRRKSSRLAGIESDGLFVHDERAGRFSIGKDDTIQTTTGTSDNGTHQGLPEKSGFYRNRINDGSPLSIHQAVEYTGEKWIDENSVGQALSFVRDTLQPLAKECNKSVSPKSVIDASLRDTVKALSVDQEECVAKVVPDRIYGMAIHPSSSQLIVCVGDKSGYVGIWNADANKRGSNDGVHLVRVHKGAVNCLQWTPSGQSLLSGAYDGTVRWFDVASEQFEQVFATYDDSESYKAHLGAGLDTGYHFYTQYACLDDRFSNEKCFFLSTSVGTAMHVDLRVNQKERITFHEELSEKKINSIR